MTRVVTKEGVETDGAIHAAGGTTGAGTGAGAGGGMGAGAGAGAATGATMGAATTTTVRSLLEITHLNHVSANRER